MTIGTQIQYNKSIKDGMTIALFNRHDGTSYMSWGTSVVIGLYTTAGVSLSDTISIDGIHWFTIYDKDKYNIYIKMMSNDSTPISFVELQRIYKPTFIYLNNTSTYRNIRVVGNITNNILKVKMTNITIPGSIEFDNLYLKYGIDGGYHIYGLSQDDYNSIDVAKLSNINFDIVVDGTDGDIILTNLRIISKDAGNITCKVDTNVNNMYVYLTTSMIENDLAIFPDIVIEDGSLINIADKETPIEFDGWKYGQFKTYFTDRGKTGRTADVEAFYCKPMGESTNLRIIYGDGTHELTKMVFIPTKEDIQKNITGITYNTNSELIGDFRSRYYIGENIIVDGEILTVTAIDENKLTTSGTVTVERTATISNSFRWTVDNIVIDGSATGNNIAIAREYLYMFNTGDHFTWNNRQYRMVGYHDASGPTIDIEVESVVGSHTPETTGEIRIPIELFAFKNRIYLSIDMIHYAKMLDLSNLLCRALFVNPSETSEYREIYVQSSAQIEYTVNMNKVVMSPDQKKIIYVVI